MANTAIVSNYHTMTVKIFRITQYALLKNTGCRITEWRALNAINSGVIDHTNHFLLCNSKLWI